MSNKLLNATSTAGSMTLLSRIGGLVRDVLFANILGDKAAADVFFVVFRIPNFFRRIFGEGAFSAAFIPVFTEFREIHGKDDTRRFLQLASGRTGLFLIVFSLLGVIFAPQLIFIMATGFVGSPEKFDLALQATRITFPYVFFVCLVALCAGMLNSCGRFAAPAATPILLNLTLICAALFLVPVFSSPVMALSVGVLVAGVIQLLFQLPFLHKERLLVVPRIRSRKADQVANEGVRKVVRLIAPAILGVSVAQINGLVNMILASFLVTGSISWLYYGERLMQFPVGVFGIALSTVILPHLSTQFSRVQPGQFASTLDWSMRLVMLICVPATIGLFVLAVPMVSTVYLHGDFTVRGVTMTANALSAFSVGMIAIVMVKVLAPGYYARQNTRTPVRIAVIAMLLNILFCLLLVSPLQHVGLAVATTLSSISNAVLLYRGLRKEGVLLLQPGWWRLLWQVAAASALMAALLTGLKGESALWLSIGTLDRVLRLSALILAGALVYIVSLYMLGIRPKMLLRPHSAG